MAIVLSEYYGLTPDIYVGPSGDDANDGLTPATALATTSGTNGAIDKSSAGDVIGVLDGTYTLVVGDFDMNADRIYAGQTFGGVKIDGSGLASITGNQSMIFGLNDTETLHYNFWVKDIQVVPSGGNSQLTIGNKGTSEAAIFKQCLFSNCIYPTEVTRSGFFSQPDTNDNIRMEMHNCIIWNIAADESISFSQVFRAQNLGDYFKLVGNTFVFNDVSWGGFLPQRIFYQPDEHELYMRNNVWLNIGTGAIDFVGSFGANGSEDVDNEMYYGTVSAWTSFPSGPNNINQDPELIDPGLDSLTEDDIKLAFRPQAGSPAIGAGVAT